MSCPRTLFHHRLHHVPRLRSVRSGARMAPFYPGPPGKRSARYYEEAFVLTVRLAGICLTTTFLPLSKP